MATIMVVDDDKENVDLLSFALTQAGHAVVSALDWRQARERLAEGGSPPELFLLDYNLPGLTGRQIFDQLQALDLSRGKPVIFMTSADSIPEKIPLGPRVKFMRKPLDMKYLQIHIRTLLERAAGP